MLALVVSVRPDVAVAQASAQEIARGRYVFGATGGCGCHTAKGQPVNAGGRRYDGPFGTVYSSNITPDRETGIGGWTDDQIVTATRSGRRPNGDRLLPVHPYPVFNGMAADDLKALTAYLRTVPAEAQQSAQAHHSAAVRVGVPPHVARGVRAPRDSSGVRAVHRRGTGRIPGTRACSLRGVPHAAHADDGDGQQPIPRGQPQGARGPGD